jgi:hypothetical protein
LSSTTNYRRRRKQSDERTAAHLARSDEHELIARIYEKQDIGSTGPVEPASRIEKIFGPSGAERLVPHLQPARRLGPVEMDGERIPWRGDGDYLRQDAPDFTTMIAAVQNDVGQDFLS